MGLLDGKDPTVTDAGTGVGREHALAPGAEMGGSAVSAVRVRPPERR